MWRAIPWSLLLASCAAAPGAIAGAIANTAVAATASGISRASGGCYANCPEGTRCEPTNGFCEPIRCRGRCSTDEECQVTALSERCVPKAGAPLDFRSDPPAIPAPTDPR